KAKQNSVTFGDPSKGQVALHNVAAGNIAKDSHDAVNGDQLHSLGDKAATYFGGGSTFADGAFTAPTYKISNITDNGTVTTSSYNDVGSAFAGLDTSVKNVNTHLTNEVKNFTDKVTNITQKFKGDALLWSDTAHAFVAQHEKKEEKEDNTVVVTQENSKITSLAAGAISETSTDAVNGSQLHTLGTGVATSLGGGAVYKDGAWTAPTFKVKTVKDDGNSGEENYSDVASAFAGVGNSITNVKNEITKQINNEIANVKGDSLVKKDATTNLITIGKEVEGSEINIANKTGTDRTLSGVKAATKDNEAVNKGQLEKGLTDLSNSLQSDESAVVHYDKQKDDKIDYANVTFGGKDKTAVGLHNVAAGKIAKDSRDAITGGQINTISQEVAKFLGGSATFADGAFTAPTYKISNIAEDGTATEDSYNDVGSAFAGLDTNFKNVNTHLTNVVNEFTEKVTNITQEVQGDALLWNKDQGAFVAQHEKKEEKEDGKVVVTQENSKITSLAAGAISETSTDAVNGSQLHTLGTVVAKSLGGNAKYENGAWTAPTFTVKTVKADGSDVEENSYESVAEAFAGVGTSFTNIHNEINKEIDKVVGDSLVKQDAETKVIQIGGEKEGTAITVANSKGDVRSISGVKAGNLSEGSTEAVNGSQLYSLNTTLAKYFGGNAAFKDGALTAPTYKISNIAEDGTATEKSYNDVGSAFAGLDMNFKNVNTHLTNVVNEFTEKVTNITQEVQGDALLWNKDQGAFVAQHGEGDAKANSKITSLQAGKITADSTDAVNGSQIYSVSDTFAKYLDGGAGYDNEGKWIAPTFKVTTFNDDGSPAEQEYESVAAAFAGVSSSFTKLHNEISDNIEQNALLWSDEESAFVALHGKEDVRSKSKLKSLLDGDISEGSTEAITGNQLYLMSNQLSAYFGGGAGYKAGEWIAPTFNVAQFNSDGSSSEKKSYHDVAGAFDGVSESMSSINERIKEVSDNRDTNSLNWNEDKGSYDASHKGASSKITNVASGKIEEGSQEVVNGGQLWTVNEKVKEVENKVDTIDQQVKDITTAVTDGAVNYDKDADGKKTNSITLAGGNESDPVLIDNVADGKIEEGSKQAVNGGQLHDYTEQQMKTVLEDAKKYTDDQVNGLVNNGVNEAKSYTDMKFETLNYAIEDVRKEARQAAAVGLAAAGLRYSDIPGKLTLAFGSGVWRSQSAFAVGAGYTSENGDIGSNLSITT
ncbi:Vomp family autotransporter, partial [Bartonella sp. MR90HLJMH]|uniref:Vomp family autotransporter n=1 Tax=Bartonella sp. MR90HLJMH TaxID=3243559 RepID=UPI0035D08B36